MITDSTNVQTKSTFVNWLNNGFINIASLSKKVADLEALLVKENPDIFGIHKVIPKFAHEKPRFYVPEL